MSPRRGRGGDHADDRIGAKLRLAKGRARLSPPLAVQGRQDRAGSARSFTGGWQRCQPRSPQQADCAPSRIGRHAHPRHVFRAMRRRLRSARMPP
jgi:hypothetical protein